MALEWSKVKTTSPSVCIQFFFGSNEINKISKLIDPPRDVQHTQKCSIITLVISPSM